MERGEFRVRDAGGSEHRYSREGLQAAVDDGQITPTWEIFHQTASRWLPISVHPAFRARSARRAPSRRSPDLVLIYPEELEPRAASPAIPPDPEPFEPGPVLTAEEIDRVLSPPRRGGPSFLEPQTTHATRSTPEIAESLLRTARRSLPTFSRAVSAAAVLVASRA